VPCQQKQIDLATGVLQSVADPGLKLTYGGLFSSKINNNKSTKIKQWDLLHMNIGV
jgi:hypothetical protein